jgi:WS/DGAT/MGAT family acyltransferase
MAGFGYERLSFLDHSFLIAESPTQHMHIAGTATYEAGPLRLPDGGIDIQRIRAYVESRLHLIPRYRQVLSWTTMDGPVWVDDHHFNIDYHVRHTALPKPGDTAQLKRLSGRVMSQQLDRSKPLWEMWVVEGLDGGERFALVTKVHHCMIDGMSSVDLLEVLLTPQPTEGVVTAPRWIPRPVPSGWNIFGAEMLRRMYIPLEALRDFREFIARAEDPRGDLRAMLRAVRDTVWTGLRPPSNTPLNAPIGPHRRFDWLTMRIDDVKAVKNRLGGSLNDVVLATVAGAVQRFLEDRRVNVEHLDFRVMAPVSVRTGDERGTMGNRVSAWVVDLPIAERDPRKRLARIQETTRKLKDSKQALRAEMLTKVVSWTPSTLLSLGSRMVMRALPFNLVVTNVPGPQVPLYLLGARMMDNYGMVPLTDYLGLGIVLFSYAGTLCWGFNADWDLVPDLERFVAATEESFRELREAPEHAELVPESDEEARVAAIESIARGGTARHTIDVPADGSGG